MMFESRWSAVKACVIHIALLNSCFIGDVILSANVSILTFRHRAIIDNVIHGIVGILSWSVVTNGMYIEECLLSGFLASLIDIDHFIAARSLNLKDALNLSTRPPFHNTFLLFIPFVSFLTANLLIKSEKLQRFAFLYITAVISHHVRDGYRRGITLNPLPNIPHFQYWIYILIILTFPHLIRLFITQQALTTSDNERITNTV